MSKAYLSTQLRRHRKRACLTQQDVATVIASLSGTTVSRHETGDRALSLEDAFAYEALFGVPASVLFPVAYEKSREGVKARVLGLLVKLARDGTDTPAARHRRLFLESVLRRLRS